MKKLLSLIASLLVLATSVQAATSVTTATIAPPNTSLLSETATITRIQVLAGAAASTFKFYDNSLIATTNASGIPVIVVAAHTNMTSYATNWNNVITNTLGILQTNTIRGIFTTTAVVAAATNALPVLAAAAVGSGGALDLEGLNIPVTRGLIVNLASSATGTVILTYRSEE